MQDHINQAMRSVEKKEYFKAVVHIRIVYSNFYTQKRNISMMYPKKNHIQIANSQCIKYKNWRDSFLSIDNKGLKILNSIEKYSATSEKNFISIDGDDILKMTRAMRNHCHLFASLRKHTKEEDE